MKRKRHDGDVTLPKGHVKEGESWEEAAKREIAEEVGWTVRLIEQVEPTAHLVRGVPKLVVWFRAEAITDIGAVGDPGEIDHVDWVPPEEATSRLSYDNEKDLVRAIYGQKTRA